MKSLVTLSTRRALIGAFFVNVTIVTSSRTFIYPFFEALVKIPCSMQTNMCEDVDECAEVSGLCAPGQCLNTQPGYQCR